jgi:uncharacterized protein YjbI with pentapeptide repeats
MADQDMLGILERGVNAWNEWRKENPAAKPDLSGAVLVAADLRMFDFSGANLTEAHLSGAFLDRAQLNDANLTGAKLFRAHLGGSNLRQADLSNADLGGAHLASAELAKANLRGCRLKGANLYAADLTDADLTDAVVGRTIFGNVDLSHAKGLPKVKHLESSTIGIDTFWKSKGKIPVSFLRGAGVSEATINQLKKLKIG